MINAECSGLAYSSNPGSKLKSEILIKACLGYGNVIDKIVPDLYTINKKDLSIKDIQINEQEFALVRDNALGEDKKKFLKEKGKKQKINDKLIREIARITKRVSELLKGEYMLEWCIYKDKVYILQAKELEMDFEDETKETKEEIKEESLKEEIEKETVDIKEPELEEDLAALEEIETEDIDLSSYEPEPPEKTEMIEPKKTDEIIKKEEVKRNEKDFFDYIHKVEGSLIEKPEVTFKIDEETKEDRIPTIDEIEEVEDKKPIFEEPEIKKDLAYFDLIRELTQKMELQLEEKDVDGYKETMEKLKRILEGV